MSRDDRATSGHGLSRCDLLKTTAGAAVALHAAAEIPAACGMPGTTSGELPYEMARPQNPVTLPLNGDPIPTDTPIEQGAELQTPRLVGLHIEVHAPPVRRGASGGRHHLHGRLDVHPLDEAS
jgi:hypothetical protein